MEKRPGGVANLKGTELDAVHMLAECFLFVRDYAKGLNLIIQVCLCVCVCVCVCVRVYILHAEMHRYARRVFFVCA
jgi:hypothetical protein